MILYLQTQFLILQQKDQDDDEREFRTCLSDGRISEEGPALKFR